MPPRLPLTWILFCVAEWVFLVALALVGLHEYLTVGGTLVLLITAMCAVNALGVGALVLAVIWIYRRRD